MENTKTKRTSSKNETSSWDETGLQRGLIMTDTHNNEVFELIDNLVLERNSKL